MINVKDKEDALQHVIKHLKTEILRLKIKSGEGITKENLEGDFGEPKSFNMIKPE